MIEMLENCGSYTDMHPERQLQQNNLRTLMRAGKRIHSPFHAFKASHKMSRLLGNLLLKTYRKESIVGFRSIIVPSEIYYALDAIPLCVESLSAMLTDAHLSSQMLDVSEKHHYSKDICSFLRCTAGMAIENILPTPDFLICTSYYCDGCPKLFENLAKKYKKKCFILDIPYHFDTADAVDYLAKQIEDMMKEIEKITGRKMNPDKLTETIRLANEAREYFLKVNGLRKSIPSPMLGGEAMDYAVMLAFTWGLKEMVEVCKLLYEELYEKIKQNNNADSKQINKKLRLLWRHLRPYYNNEIINFIENNCGAEIAFEEINYIHWDKMDPSDPYRSLARKLLANPPVGHFEHWLEATHNFIKWYKIDGVISFNHWGCRQLGSGTGILKSSLEKERIPFLEIDGDCIDPRDYSSQQLKTRVYAFIEMMASMKL